MSNDQQSNGDFGPSGYQPQMAAIDTGQPMFQPNLANVDTLSLTRAQGIFIKNQTTFLLQTHPVGSPEFLEELGKYSRSQTDLIEALQRALHQVGVL